VVVDESSMVDVWLAAHLGEAMGPRTRLVLVGDADQLPSVGAGLVLRQVIESGMAPTAALREIFRQDKAGLLAANAHRILNGNMPETPGADQEADFFFIPEDDPQAAAQLIRSLVCERLPRRYGLDPVRDIQVLSPMHRGAMGCQHLNDLLRAALNPGAGGAGGGGGFRRGDKVMQVRNNYDLDAFNGDLGLVADASGEGCRVDMGGRLLEYSLMDLDDLTLAYAVTVHKSQGSEYPAVVMALGMEHYIMLNRPLLYTGVTRGKQLVVLAGSGRALRKAVETADPTRRNARLDKRIRDELKDIA
jgi:exodeoxyribonuclease V alpha subunit